MNRLRRRQLSTFSIQHEAKDAINQTPSFQSSPVYRRHGLDVGLSPRLVRHTADLRMLDWNKFNWAGPRSFAREHARFRDADKGPKSVSTYPTRGFRKRSMNTSREASSLISEDDFASTSRSLPALPTNGWGEPMLRRPTVKPPKPIEEGGDLFKMITKTRELKPFSFAGDPRKTTSFYNEHYPLLCKKVHITSHPGSAPATVTQQDMLRPSTAVRRTKDLFDRMSKLDLLLSGIENDPDEPIFTTELRNKTFDPTTWSWNKSRYPRPKRQRSGRTAPES